MLVNGCKYKKYFYKCKIKSGESRIRTYEAEATELQSVPFDRSGISPDLTKYFKERASRGIRTHDPEITNHVLWPTELWRQVSKALKTFYFRFAIANVLEKYDTTKLFIHFFLIILSSQAK